MELASFQEEFLSYAEDKNLIKEPSNLYKPIDYIMKLGGKKMRPALTLMSASVFSSNYKKALPAAFAIEIFHNFTLIHDDIIDDAPLRRGKKTVHEKWNINTGILSGDAMLILAYQHLECYSPAIFQKVVKLLSKTALEVCDGQQLDIDFETRNDVTIPEYIKMISLKTAVLIGAALKIGAIVSNANEDDSQKIYDFGLNLGIAFQLQDDYLDTFGNPETFGKQASGDIIENKKTYLYLKSLEVVSENDKETLIRVFNEKNVDNLNKIKIVKYIFEKNCIAECVKNQINTYTNIAFSILETMQISADAKNKLKKIGVGLMSRNV